MGKLDANASQNSATDAMAATSEQKPHDRYKSNAKISERVRKKSWYNVIYPSYKSRSQTFKKLFKDVPSDERLIVGEFS